MWQEKLQDTAASHPWLEPHEAIKRKTEAPGMQLVDWYGFTVPKTKKEMFLKQSARREDLLVVGEVDNIHSFFSDYETEWRSNILFDDLDEALRYCEDVRSGFISDIQLHSSFIMYKEPGFKAMPGGGFAGWSDLFYAAHGNLEYANKLLFDCQAGDRDGMDPRQCAREDLINGVIAEFGSEYIMTGDAGQKNRLNSVEILRFELNSVPTDGNGHITGYFHGFPLGTSLEDISAAIDDVGKVENGHLNRIDVPEEPERIEVEQNAGVSKEKPPIAEMEDTSIREPKSHPTQPKKPVWTNLEVAPDSVILLTGVSRKTDRSWYRADCTLGEESSIKPGGKFKILLSERQYARADAQQKAGKPVSLGLKTARYPDGVEIDGEMVALEDLAADINVRKTDPLPKSPEEYRGATEQSFNGNEWVNFHFFPDLVDLSKFIDPDTARTDYRADVTSEIAGRNCSFTLHLAKWQYDKAVKDQNQNSPIHIGMKLKYIKGGVIPVQFEGEQFTHNYSPKKLEESLPKVQKARSVSGCRQGKGNRISSYQDRSYRFKTKEVYERGLPGTHESRN
ncbi:hypothetical protein [Coprococcus comes]|uniref:hypothetical protein n=1 Tax=Coprococcus comes TaxID=410072 RepID=UPI00189AA01E|nr:hypothetical protein [Coprococcus comes]